MNTLWLLFILGVCACVGHAEEKEYVTDEDKAAAAKAEEEQHVFCQGAEVEDAEFTLDLKHRKGDLQGALGGNNVITEVLTRAKNGEEVPTVFMENYGYGWMMKQAAALIFAGVTAVVAIIFCIASRCYKCRCCEERPTSNFYKMAAAVIVGIVLLGIVICTWTSVNAFSEVAKGGKNAQCTTLQFLSTALNGKTAEPAFIGLLPLLDDLKEASEALDLEGNTGLAEDIEDILKKTDEIKLYVDAATETLKLLMDTMALNLKPKDPADGTTSMLHECLLCKVLHDKAQQALNAMSGSVANKLALCREDVNSKNTPEHKAHMKRDLEEIRKAMVKHKTTIRENVIKMLKEDSALRKMKESESLVEKLLLGFVILGTVIALFLACCAGVSAYRFIRFEMDESKEDENNNKVNPYNKNIPWYAGTTWCYGFLYMVIVLVLAAIIQSITAVGSGACLLASDLDSDLLSQMKPVFGINESSTQLDKDEFDILQDVVDKCLNPANQDKSVQQYLLDMIYTRENGQKVYQREQLSRSEEASKAVFSQITDSAKAAYVPLADIGEIRKLLNLIKPYKVAELLRGDKPQILSRFPDLKFFPGKDRFLPSTMACNDKSVTELMMKTIGIESFSTELSQLGTGDKAVSHGCIKTTNCKTAPAIPIHRAAACKYGNKYLEVKASLMDMEAFRCDLFQKPDDPSSYCDPINMQCSSAPAPAPGPSRRLNTLFSSPTRRLSAPCTGLCVDSDGKATSKEKKCKLQEFTDYVSGYHGRLEKLIKHIDSVVGNYKPSIKNSIDLLLETHGASKAQSIANSATCNFIAGYYQELLNGACYQGIWGARRIAKCFVWAASLTALLVGIMYAVWCRAMTNQTKWTPDRKAYEAKKKAQEPKPKDEEQEFLLGGTQVQAPVERPKTKFSDLPEEEDP